MIRLAARRTWIALFITLLTTNAFAYRDLGQPDFDKASAEALELLRRYLQVDTTNPPGHERRAAEFLKAVFDREGIPCQVFDQGSDRANVVAVLKGNGRSRPLILFNHLDVVPADAERWTVPPFAGEIRDGYIWGRGATDMKGTAICQLMTMLLLHRQKTALDRDVIFLGTADEEEGTASGIDWMIANHPEALGNAEFALTEGAFIQYENGKSVSWDVDVTEKSVLWLKVVATGQAGHASIPASDGAVAKLVRALNRLLAYAPPPRLIPAVENYFRAISVREPSPLKEDLADPARALTTPEGVARLTADPFRNACLRTTISVTGLRGSDKVNVIPGEASALIDCRLLPGEDPRLVLETLKSVAGDETLRFDVLSMGAATESTIDTVLFRAIEKARDRFDPGVPVLTPPLTSSTDASSLRRAGVVVYGFEPFRIADEDDRSHGDDERLSLDNLKSGVEITFAIVSDVCASAAFSEHDHDAEAGDRRGN